MEHEELTGQIIAAAIVVHRELGPGFLESVYEKALVVELRRMGLKVEPQREIAIMYRDVEVGTHRLDLLVEELIVVELKASSKSASFASSVPDTLARPTAEADIGTVPWSEVCWQITPGGAGTEDPENGLHKQTVVDGTAAWIRRLTR